MRKAKTVLKAAASKRRKMKQIEKEKNLITADVPPAKEVPRKNKVQRKGKGVWSNSNPKRIMAVVMMER